jgi:hypothetical protein
MRKLVQGPKQRVLLGIPAGDEVKTHFAYDLATMIGATVATAPDIEIHMNFTMGTILPMSRQTLVAQALAVDATHLLFLDSDMRFPSNTIIQLLSRKEPIVGALYPMRKHPIRTVAKKDGEYVYVEPGATGLLEVDWLGTGVMLVDMDVFKALTPPWFHLMYHEDQATFSGEDIWFCHHARAAGLRILVDQDLSHHVHHVGSFEYKMEHALVTRDLERQQRMEALSVGTADV